MPYEPFQRVHDSYLQIAHWMNQDCSLIAGFSTRKGGVSKHSYKSLNVGFHVDDNEDDVRKNRLILAGVLQFPLEHWVVAEQVHGTKVEKVTLQHRGKGAFCLGDALKGVDGIYTKEKGILLVSLYADCVPLYFYSKKDNTVGLAHAGWRGTVGGIGQEMIRLWTKKEHIPLENIEVAIGPSISKEAYLVDDFVIRQVARLINQDDPAPYEKISENQYLLDLKLLNYLLLRKMGLKNEQIRISNYCTANNNDLFFSHRYEKGKTGRMMSFIGFRTG